MFDISGLQFLLGNASIGFIPSWIIGIFVVIVVAILINGRNGDKVKTIQTMAPLSVLLLTLGFTLHLAFILIIFLAFGVTTIIGTEFKEQVIES